jgi:hypothetical protein
MSAAEPVSTEFVSFRGDHDQIRLELRSHPENFAQLRVSSLSLAPRREKTGPLTMTSGGSRNSGTS